MDRAQITQQTSATLPLGGELRHEPHLPEPAPRVSFRASLQWALEGRGWALMRPTVDLVMLCGAVLIAIGGASTAAHVSSEEAPLLALPPIVLILFYVRGLYRARLRSLAIDGVAPVVSGVSVAAMLVAICGVLLSGHGPRQDLWLRAWLFAVIGVGVGRIVVSTLQRWARSRRLVGKPVLIVGAGVVGAQVALRLDSHPEYGLTPVGFLDDDPRPIAEVGGRDVPVVGSIADIEEIVRRAGVRHLIVAFSGIADARLSRLVQRCQELGIAISVVPRMFDTINSRVGYDTVGGLPLMSFASVDRDGLQFAFKHAFDRVCALLLLIVLSPVVLCAALAVRLSSPGSVLFSQRRVGRDGKIFNCHKFRSMRVQDEDEDEAGAVDLLLAGDTAPGGVEGDDRRTAVGRFLRRTSLDELPQLFNVLCGDMSLVGPRPERPAFVELFRRDFERYVDRHRVKSGITGLAQVHGLRGQTSLAERVEWDNYYIANWSFGLDLKILLLTIGALFHSTE